MSLSVNRVAKTYVISISYTASDPLKAQLIANAFADAYFAEELDSVTLLCSERWLAQ